MKQGWGIKKLGEICNKITNIKWNEIDKTTSFPYIDLSAVDRENSSIHDYEYINISNAPSRAKQIVKVGDILFATTRPMLKRACIIPNEFNNAIASTGFCVLRPQGTVLSEWIYHNIKSNRFYKYIEPIQKGVSYPAVTDNEVKDFCIPIPPREEQERIVVELDCLSGVIEKKREQLKQLDALAQSIFYQMFGDPITNEKGWEVKPLKNSVIEMFLGPFGSALKTDCYVSKEDAYCMVYEQKHAIKKTMELETHYIDKDKFESLKRFEVHSGDFIMSCRGTIGEIYRLPNDAPIGIIHPSLMKIRIKENVYHPTFFIRLLTHIVKNENTNGNCVQMAITAKELGARTPITPPLTLQQQFAERIETIERQKELIKKSISETENLFNARMDYYFN